MENIEQYFEYYKDGAAETAETVVFVPGVACGAFLFRDALKYFLPRYKVLLLNTPGVNDIPLPMNLTVEKIADIYIKVMEHLNIKKCNLIGHSMGGFVSQVIAASKPDMVEKIAMISTSYGRPSTVGDSLSLIGDVGTDIFELADGREGRRKSVEMVIGDKFKREKPEEYESFCDFYIDSVPKKSIVVRHLVCGAQYSGYDKLEKIKHKVLVVHGESDTLIKARSGKKLAAKLSNSTYWELPECGHFPMIERDDFYLRIVDFLAGSDVGVKVVDEHEEHGTHYVKEMFKHMFNKD